jgi:hypothetical protein
MNKMVTIIDDRFIRNTKDGWNSICEYAHMCPDAKEPKVFFEECAYKNGKPCLEKAFIESKLRGYQ